MTESELEEPIESSPIQNRAPHDDEEDRFLKELEQENRMLEEELKTLQKSNSRKSGIVATP